MPNLVVKFQCFQLFLWKFSKVFFLGGHGGGVDVFGGGQPPNPVPSQNVNPVPNLTITSTQTLNISCGSAHNLHWNNPGTLALPTYMGLGPIVWAGGRSQRWGFAIFFETVGPDFFKVGDPRCGRGGSGKKECQVN